MDLFATLALLIHSLLIDRLLVPLAESVIRLLAPAVSLLP